jgi:hypothetical protein
VAANPFGATATFHDAPALYVAPGSPAGPYVSVQGFTTSAFDLLSNGETVNCPTVNWNVEVNIYVLSNGVVTGNAKAQVFTQPSQPPGN